jgi:hypothetical protein
MKHPRLTDLAAARLRDALTRRFEFVCVAAVLALGLLGCQTSSPWQGSTSSNRMTAQSMGEHESGYTYIPIDPFPVETVFGDSCRDTPDRAYGALLDALPDNAVRMLVERFDISGSVSYGISKAGAKGESYRVTVDYINADTVNVPVWVAKYMRHRKTGETHPVDLFNPPTEEYFANSETFSVAREKPADDPYRPFFNIPVYVGVGLRVSATVYVVGANANISGIGVIGAEAESERLKGSLVVQTLGVNGKSVTAALPIQSELNRTTAQNAIVAVGAIKALLYAEETVKSPRVVGLYLPFPGGKALVNALISELSRERLRWPRPCLASKKAGANADR